MRSVVGTVSEVFARAIRKSYTLNDNSAAAVLKPIVTACTDPKFGDFQCNNAMGIYQLLSGGAGGGKKKQKKGGDAEVAAPPQPQQQQPLIDPSKIPKSPVAVAQEIIKNLPAADGDNGNGISMFSKTEVAGPGFINVSLSKEWLAHGITDLLRHGGTVPPPPYHGNKRVIVDFSSPNIAKEMHVGHLRSTIIGDTLARVLEYTNHDVKRINHVGDWGTQFGMLIHYLKTEYPNFLERPPPIGDLQAFYRAAKKRFDESDEFKRQSQLEVVKLQQGGPESESRAAWEMICDVSRREFQKIYDRLGIDIEERGESFYNPFIPQVIEELEQKQLLQESEGALCMFIPGSTVPLMVRKSDGGYNYDSTDLAAIWYRLLVEKADWLIYVTDIGQAQHFDLVFKGAKMSGWLDPERHRVDHVGFGLVLGDDGKKFKTRSGSVVRLVDLLDEARDRVMATLIEREKNNNEEGGPRLSPEDIANAAAVLGYGAVKYADLKNNRNSNYKFSYDTMLDLKGNTAVYLQYAHARICSIIAKANVDEATLLARAAQHAVAATTTTRAEPIIILDHPAELQLAMAILRFPDAIDQVLHDLEPHLLCDYLYDLSVKFNEFFHQCRVIGSGEPIETSRLLLCMSTAMIMRKCFHLLGMKPLTRI